MNTNKEKHNNIQIRFVSENDAKRLVSIYSYYVTDTAVSFEYTVPTVTEFNERIRTISSKYPYLVALYNNEIVGYAYAHSFIDRRAYDWSVEMTIYIDKDKRKNGIGEALYTELEEKLKDMGILNLNSCIAYPVENDAHVSFDSIKFHERMGYKTVGRFHNSGYKFNKWYDMIWMEKIIGNHLENQSNVKFYDRTK